MTKEALKLALEALERMKQHSYLRLDYAEQAITAIKEALAQPEQLPVAWMHTQLSGAITHRPADLDRHPDRWTALYSGPKPCPTCEALARTVMLDQTSHDNFKPDYNTEAVLAEEMQRMGAEIAALHTEIDTLHKILITRVEQIVGLQDEIRNLTGEE